MDIQPIASSQVESPTELKQQIQQLVEQLPVEALPEMLHFSEQLANGSLNGTNGVTPLQSSSSSESLQSKQPWLPYTAILKNYPYWDELDEAIAEYRREVDNKDEVI